MPFDFGDVVLVPFPFASQVASKKRPAVVVSNGTYNRVKPDVAVMAVTSQLRPSPGLGEVWVGRWQIVGLIRPSAIKPVFANVQAKGNVRAGIRSTDGDRTYRSGIFAVGVP
jgi:mRNA interferase MazF